ncbi:CTAG/Pcc1 family [Piptocephalis cylindrospora]|uniref:CTAG/Pcc1 family n=1 Tax=Piptocephalis cylindrospora TaxID=1907219 RepID=A0A4V1IY27_9FUNG|nr:CTAG/Pcc1 family [Piptocephalis cylindrospora]|eukprot:RKP13099.1 CTAG/Pcc1 family [Piptocephalis cylindrospora]
MSHSLSLSIPFPERRLAEHACQVLSVDPELKPSAIQRTFSVSDAGALEIHFQSDNLKLIRVSANGLLELLHVIIRTMDAFDPMKSKRT